MHKAILFDLDGVIRRWIPDITADAERRAGLPPGEILRTAFSPDLLRQAVTGEISDEHWRATVADTLTRRFGRRADGAVREWSAPVGEVDHETMALVRAQRQHRRVALISNATTRLESDLREMGIHEDFDVVLNSSRMGLAKPDPVVFRAACQALGAAPYECAYVDDTAANVEAAHRIGLRSHHFRGSDALIGFLESL